MALPPLRRVSGEHLVGAATKLGGSVWTRTRHGRPRLAPCPLRRVQPPPFAAGAHESAGSTAPWAAPFRPFVRDDLFQAFDAILGEGRDAILTDAIDAQAAVFGEHIDREFVQPIFILAERFGDVADAPECRLLCETRQSLFTEGRESSCHWIAGSICQPHIGPR
jgi:hypothetical protein